MTSLEQRVRPAAGDPAGALILLHGRGADESDLFPLFDLLDPDRRLVGACPRGPLSIPPGGAHWYVVRQVGYPDPETFFPTLERAAEWLDSFLAEQGLTHEQTVVGGFSQGGVMSYALSLGRGRPRPSGVMAFSGFIPEAEGFELDLNLDGYPVAIGHGTYDPVITVDFGRHAKNVLEKAGADVIYRESPMPHAIDPAFLTELRPWVEERFGPRGGGD
ncbi:MAG: alpha/beta hydrolase [Actinomycetota bacterium]